MPAQLDPSTRQSRLLPIDPSIVKPTLEKTILAVCSKTGRKLGAPFPSADASALVQKPMHTTLLPYVPEECAEQAKPFLFEPQPSELLDWLVPMLIEFQIFHFVSESVASEHAARMAAMDSATNNACDMIDRLTLQRNRARQAAITTELMEIISGAEAISA